MLEKKDITAQQKQLVVKSNEIIQKSRYKLSTQQQKLILYLISKITPYDEEFKEYILDLKDICQILNIDINSANYFRFRESIQKIADTSFWLCIDGVDKLYRWIDDVEINKNDTSVKIKLDEDLKPFLLQLKDNYTIYKLEKVLCFNSKYSFRLYEIFKSYAYQERLVISVEELKKKLLIEKEYKRYAMFRTNVIDIAIDEINKYTELHIEYSPIRKNRVIVSLDFQIYESLVYDKMNNENRNIKLNRGNINE